MSRMPLSELLHVPWPFKTPSRYCIYVAQFDFFLHFDNPDAILF
jgi:hypothetical protein